MKRIKREKKQTHIDTEGSWAISYGDMITLLLGFFILFFSLDPAEKKESKISQSLLVTMQSLDKEAAKQAAREAAPSAPASHLCFSISSENGNLVQRGN